MSISPDFFTLLDLQKALAPSKFDRLGMKYLDLLRMEVDLEIERRCAKSREKPTEASSEPGEDP